MEVTEYLVRADSLLPLGGSLGLEQQVPLPVEASHMPKNPLNKNCMTGVPSPSYGRTTDPSLRTPARWSEAPSQKDYEKKLIVAQSVVCSVDWRKPWVYSPVLPKSGIVVLACNP